MSDEDVEKIARRAAQLVWEKLCEDRNQSQQEAIAVRTAAAELQAVAARHGVEIEGVPGGYQVTRKK